MQGSYREYDSMMISIFLRNNPVSSMDVSIKWADEWRDGEREMG